MTNPLIEKLTKALDAKTAAALAQLEGLEGEIALAFAQAERDADHAIAAALVRLESALGIRSSQFEERLAEMASSAFDAALERLGHTVQYLGSHVNGKEVEVPTEQQAELVFHPGEQVVCIDDSNGAHFLVAGQVYMVEDTQRDSAGGLRLVLAGMACAWEAERFLHEQPAETTQEAEPVYASAQAAQVIDVERPGVLAPDDDDEEDEDDPDDEDDAAAAASEVPSALELVYSPEGLHTRHETGGRRARYEPVSDPQPGETYYLRDGRRHWNRVVYAG